MQCVPLLSPDAPPSLCKTTPPVVLWGWKIKAIKAASGTEQAGTRSLPVCLEASSRALRVGGAAVRMWRAWRDFVRVGAGAAVTWQREKEKGWASEPGSLDTEQPLRGDAATFARRFRRPSGSEEPTGRKSERPTDRERDWGRAGAQVVVAASAVSVLGPLARSLLPPPPPWASPSPRSSRASSARSRCASSWVSFGDTRPAREQARGDPTPGMAGGAGPASWGRPVAPFPLASASVCQCRLPEVMAVAGSLFLGREGGT